MPTDIFSLITLASKALERKTARAYVFAIIGRICYYAASFLFWVGVYLLAPKGFFAPNIFVLFIVALGIAVFVFSFVGVFYQQWKIESYLAGLPDRIKQISVDDQTEEEKEGDFTGPISKLAIPYIYFDILGFRAYHSRQRISWVLIGIMVNACASYAIAALVAMNSQSLVSVFQLLPQEILLLINSLIPRYLIPLTVFFYLLSFLDPYTWWILPYSKLEFLGRAVSRSFAISLSIIDLYTLAFSELHRYNKKLRFALTTAPFFKTLDVPAMIKKSFQNVEGESIRVLHRSYKIKSTEDAEIVRKMVCDEEKLPRTIRDDIRKLGALAVSDTISELPPSDSYVSLRNGRCVVFGQVRYTPSDKSFIAQFIFDSKHVKDEFEAITAKAIERRRELEPRT